jgi:hypothetical protein
LLLSSANSWSPGDWAPGQPLDLQAVTMQALDTGVGKKLTALAESKSGTDGLPTGAGAAQADRYEWLAFFNLLDAPNYLQSRGGMEGPPLQRRETTHQLDLSRWATRPCVVVLATLNTSGEDSLPAPVRVATNGSERRPYCSGTTIVRWVYPLAPNPPEVEVDAPPEGEDTGPGAGGD